MILISCYGWTLINNKPVKRVILSLFIVINLYALLVSPFSALKLPRPETIKTVSYYLERYNLGKDDMVSMPYGGTFLSRYYEKKVQMLDFNIVDTFQNSNRTLLERVFIPELIDSVTWDNVFPQMKDFLSSPYPSPPFYNFISSNIDKVKKGHYFIIVISRGIAVYTNNDLMRIIQDDNYYKAQSMMFMLSAKTQNDMIRIAQEKLSEVDVITDRVWEIHVFIRK
jgi:hypothetical protein